MALWAWNHYRTVAVLLMLGTLAQQLASTFTPWVTEHLALAHLDAGLHSVKCFPNTGGSESATIATDCTFEFDGVVCRGKGSVDHCSEFRATAILLAISIPAVGISSLLLCFRFDRIAAGGTFAGGLMDMLAFAIFQATYDLSAEDKKPGFYLCIGAWLAAWTATALLIVSYLRK